MDGLRIERPVSADLHSIDVVYEQAISLAFADEGFSEEAAEEIEYKKSLVRKSIAVSDADTVFMVAKLDGKVIGTISFGPCGDYIKECTNGVLNDVGELGGLYVLPSYQGQGVGSALIRAMIQHLDSIGVQQFCLDCGLKAAQKKWRRKFGTPYMIAKDYWGEGADHLIWLCYVVDWVR